MIEKKKDQYKIIVINGIDRLCSLNSFDNTTYVVYLDEKDIEWINTRK